MREAQTPLSYATIVATLQQLCAEKRSGALIITGDRPTRIHLANGEITALFMQEKKGQEVVPLLARLKAHRMDFIQSLPCSQPNCLAATIVLLAELAAQGGTPSTPEALVSDTTAPGLDATVPALISETLAQYIGPIATVLCKRLLGTHQNIEETLQALAAHIPDAGQARHFTAAIRTKLAARV